MFTAVEKRGAIRKALRDLERALATDAQRVSAFGGEAYWHTAEGFWSYFGRSISSNAEGWRYWNGFGTTPEAFKRNITVEINPPQSGGVGNTQGVIATDKQGQRWVLHRGRLNGVTQRMFDARSSVRPVRVLCSTGKEYAAYPVANLDGTAAQVREQVGEFVRACSLIRLFYRLGDDGKLESKVQEAEGESKSRPEATGGYTVPARGSVQAERIHADVWKALTTALDERQISHSNSRVGAYGPDLRCAAPRRLLFEIKTDCAPASIYEAVGQLFLYEKILGEAFRKVAVIPDIALPGRLADALKELEIDVLPFARRGSSVTFKRTALDAVL